MANKSVFPTTIAAKQPAANTTNAAGGKAYAMSDKHALAQIACTNCFNGTYYVDAETNFALAKSAVERLKGDPEFLAKVAVYSRDKAYMKDMPAFICTMLAGIDTKLFRSVFRKVVDNGKMLRNVIQMARSGACGKKANVSAGTWRHAIQEWFDNKTPHGIFKASIGNDPSMRDILRMSRPKPRNKERVKDAEKEALFGYLVGKAVEQSTLPPLVQSYERYKVDKSGEVPDVDFRFLDSLSLDTAGWTAVARRANWTMTRMNLNTFKRHGVLVGEMVQLIADRLRNKDEIRQAKAFPYQLLMAYNATTDVPHEIREALQDAMEIATENVPEFAGQGYVCADTSGSMSSAVTGSRGSATSAVQCIDAAALFAACVLRNNRSARILPFDTRVHANTLNGRDTVMTNAAVLSRFGGGGTDCGCALESLNQENAQGKWVVFVSDNESWFDGEYRGSATKMQAEWVRFAQRNEGARLICIDLTPNPHSQVKTKANILQVGGFSDNVFTVVKNFIEYGHENAHWTREIESIEL